MQTKVTLTYPQSLSARPAERAVVLHLEEEPFLNPNVGDDTRYVRATLEAGEAAEAMLPYLREQRNPAFMPAASDSSERLACLAGMAATRLDARLVEQAFHILERRFLSAAMPAERVLILEALYHACGYESRLFLTDLKRRCDRLFDDQIPADLVTPRLLFYRYCPTALERTVSRSAACGRWRETLQTWLCDLEASPGDCWSNQSQAVVFRRLRYLYRTGCKHLSGVGKAAYYRHLVIGHFLDVLLAFLRQDTVDVATLVSAYEALREFRFDVKANVRHYKPLMAKVTALQSTLPHDSHSWLRLEELRQDYATALTFLPYRLHI